MDECAKAILQQLQSGKNLILEHHKFNFGGQEIFWAVKISFRWYFSETCWRISRNFLWLFDKFCNFFNDRLAKLVIFSCYWLTNFEIFFCDWFTNFQMLFRFEFHDIFQWLTDKMCNFFSTKDWRNPWLFCGERFTKLAIFINDRLTHFAIFYLEWLAKFTIWIDWLKNFVFFFWTTANDEIYDFFADWLQKFTSVASD